MTGYFDKYRFPPTAPQDIEYVLKQFGFTLLLDDGESRYFGLGERRVPIPREPNLVGITILDIISQSAIDENAFLEALNRYRRERNG